MLHDIGMSVDYDDHHKHSRYLILNAGLPGFAPAEVAIIAQAARYHRKGMPGARAAGGAVRRAATPSAWTAAPCCCAWPRTSSARATSSCARRTSSPRRRTSCA